MNNTKQLLLLKYGTISVITHINAITLKRMFALCLVCRAYVHRLYVIYIIHYRKCALDVCYVNNGGCHPQSNCSGDVDGKIHCSCPPDSENCETGVSNSCV